MTAFSIVSKGKVSKAGNRKDGRSPRPDGQTWDHFSPEAQAARERTRWEAEGLTIVGHNKWSYSWPGVRFPVIGLRKGLVVENCNIRFGIIAEHERSDTKEIFGNNTHPANIKARLDDIILDIMRHDAEADELPLDWQPDEIEIDIDDFMAGRWVRS